MLAQQWFQELHLLSKQHQKRADLNKIRLPKFITRRKSIKTLQSYFGCSRPKPLPTVNPRPTAGSRSKENARNSRPEKDRPCPVDTKLGMEKVRK